MLGYWRRLRNNVISDKKHYAVRDNLTQEDLVAHKRYTASAYVPPSILKTSKPDFSTDRLPRVYLLKKTKCLKRHGKGLSCTKGHAHVREIHSNWKEPLKNVLRLAARGLRFCMLLSKRPTWTLWRSADICRVMEEKVGRLRRHPRRPGVCPTCGTHLKLGVTLLKVDAAQFFQER